jgi:predicted dehydrogenase
MRVAIIGAGLMGRWHAAAARAGGGSVVAVIDGDSERARQLVRARVPRASALVETDIERALSKRPFDVAHICTPPQTHVALSHQLLELGVHVLVEKPMAPTADETADLLKAAAARGRFIVPVHQFPFQRGVQRVAHTLESIAPVLHFDLVTCSAGAGATGGPIAERVAADILPHPLSLLHRFLGGGLAGLPWKVHASQLGEWRIACEHRGTTIGIVISMRGRPTTNNLRLTGARGTAYIDLFHDFAVIERPGVSRGAKITHPFVLAGATLGAAAVNLAARALRNERAYPGLRSLVEQFYRAVRGDGPAPIDSDSILDIAHTSDVLLQMLGAERENGALL